MLVMDPYKSISRNQLQPEGPMPFGIKDLLEGSVNWDLINAVFNTSAPDFEELLFRIHYKRKKTLSLEERMRILNFLFIGYSVTGDIRYFNEFLWFYVEAGATKSLMDGCMKKFRSNLDSNGCHSLTGKMKEYPVDINGYDLRQVVNKHEKKLKICLIGFPPFFGTIVKQLKKEGHHVEQFFLPHHPNRHISRLLKIKTAVKVLSFLTGNFSSYRTLNYDHKDDRIGMILREQEFDIGFHKLNFIIRQNIFNAFRIGLLNDHWGYLPMLRGKSTIAYSLLLNIPVIPTIHFIEKGIDTGPIAGYCPCDYNGAKNVKEVRNVLRKKMPERVIAAIEFAGSKNFVQKQNRKEAGITFYEIHPWLNNHITANILK